MELPNLLVDEIKNGRAILFLGAGASIGAISENNSTIPMGKDLSNLLINKFLNGKFGEESLDFVSELCISQKDLTTVQQYIKEIFINFNPADFHLLIPTFKWKCIFTTNYDLIIEKAYSQSTNKIQEAIPFISNYDKIDEKISSRDNVAYVKLHGCITRVTDPNLPLILTPDQYVTYDKNRDRLFNLLYEKGAEYSIIFIGHGGKDYDIRRIMLKLDSLQNTRPRYYFIKPSITQEESDYWTSKRVTTLDYTLKSFLDELDSKINFGERKLHSLFQMTHPIEKHFSSNIKLSKKIFDLLNYDLEYIHTNMAINNEDPQRFYKGFDLGWYPIANNLDLKRAILDEVLTDIFLNELDRASLVELFVIKAEAGGGKTTFLKRLAWDACGLENFICLFKKSNSPLKYEDIYEIYRSTNERIFLFIDNAADCSALIEEIIIKSKQDKIKLSIIITERVNEWNNSCEQLDPYITKFYNLKYLTEHEITSLVNLLETNNSLGVLSDFTHEERIEKFKKEAGRQILVALYEATLGKPFQEILIDEYNNILPPLAQSIYLTVCILNRLKIPVRAGIISRIYGISFSDFQKQFFKPLEHVVNVYEDFKTDYFYVTRHSLIAQIVFESILTNNNEKYNEYTKVLGNLNILYFVDKFAFRQMVKSKNLSNLFPDYSDVKEIFKLAHQISRNDPYVFQQQGIYEMNRDNGNLSYAYELLNTAHKIDERDLSIVHSFSELARLRADKSNTVLEKQEFRNESIKLSETLLKDKSVRKFGIMTILKVKFDSLKDLIEINSLQSDQINKIIIDLEHTLNIGLQEYPYDSYLLSFEADFSNLISEETRALTALKKAFDYDKRNPFITNRLAKYYLKINDLDSASLLLKQALDRNPNDKWLHFQYAKVLMKVDESDLNRIIFHFRRSFTSGDKNYEAQFWYARYLYEKNDIDTIEESKNVFKNLREIPLLHNIRITIRSYLLDENSNLKEYTGVIIQKDNTYGFISIDGKPERLFFHEDNSNTEVWSKLRYGDRVKFNVGFNLSGPLALNYNKL